MMDAVFPGNVSPGLKTALKTEALRLGFSLFGVTHAGAPRTLPAYLQWLEDGRHGQMQYLAAERAVERRANPSRILPEVKSIIVLGLRYPKPEMQPSAGNELIGQVAAYAWGVDYHHLIPPRLESLAAFLRSETGKDAVFRIYTDTGPILERDLASRAGLGWQGKNTCLIHPEMGSYFLLGEILTSMELEPDAPFEKDYCGSCRRCIDACPTGCILPDRTIDARRCISYLTIENKGTIPIELRSQMGSWVFGCDICQQVCPWNIRFAGGAPESELHPSQQIAYPRLVDELGLSVREFNQKFKNRPLLRARRRGYLRNIAVALGNSGSEIAVPALIKALCAESEPLVRAHAAWALGEIGGERSERVLIRQLRTESDSEVSAEIRSALSRLRKSVPHPEDRPEE